MAGSMGTWLGSSGVISAALNHRGVEGTAPVLPMRPDRVERQSHDYVWHGTTDPFAALDVKAGTVIGACKGRHRATEFRAFLDQVEAAVPADLDVQTTQPPTRRAWSTTGCSSGPDGTSTSAQPPPPGCTLWSAGSLC